jgi:hypothetical protein
MHNFTLSEIISIVKIVAPDGKIVAKEYIAINPVRPDNQLGSFKINIDTGAWSDFATGNSGGSIVSYVAYCLSTSNRNAIKWLEEKGYGDKPLQDKPSPRKTESEQLKEIPADFPAHPTKHLKKGNPDEIYKYSSGIVMRFNGPPKSFSVLTPWIEKGQKVWKWKGFLEPRPLYNIKKINPDLPIIIVEGEKCVHAGKKITDLYNFVTWPGGAQAVKKADWNILKDKKCIIIPDNDVPGIKAAQYVSTIINAKVCSVGEKPDGWDIADGCTEEELKKIIEVKDCKQIVFPVGFKDKEVVFYSKFSKQYYTLAVSELKNFIILYPDSNYWKSMYPECVDDKYRIIVSKLTEKLIYDCQITGRHIGHIKTREVGIFNDNDRTIVNYGDKIFIDGIEKEYNEIESEYFYKTNGKSYLNSNNSEYNLEKTLEKMTLSKEIDRMFFLGAIIQGYLSGSVQWRTHIWITGETGSGKSKYYDLILRKAIVPIHGVCGNGDMTEAGIRQNIGDNYTIFVHDEAEKNEHSEKELTLIRNSSSGGTILRGTQNQEGTSFSCNCTFILLSISASIEKAADEQRIVRVFLKQNETTQSQWPQVEKELIKNCTIEYFSGIMQRCARIAKNFNKSNEIIRESFIDKFKTVYNIENISRAADTYSVLLCGYWHWQHDDIIDSFNCEILLDKIKKSGRVNFLSMTEEKQTNSAYVLEQFYDYQITENGKKRTIRQLIYESNNHPETENELAAYGIHLKYKTSWCVFLVNNNRNLAKIFSEIGYSDYKNVLSGIEGVELQQAEKITGKTQRGVLIPLNFELETKRGEF